MATDATSERPLRADAERNRQRILDAAADLFAERGLQVSLDEVAERAGVGVGTVYRRFPDREALIDALFQVRVEEFIGIAREAAADPDAWAGLTRFIEHGDRVPWPQPRAQGADVQRPRRARLGRSRCVPGSARSSGAW